MALVFFFLIPAPILTLLLFRFVPIPGTPQMLASLLTGKGAHYQWSGEISPRLERAVIGAEDQNFCTHHGFDFAAIQKALDEHKLNPSRRAARRQAPSASRLPAPCSWAMPAAGSARGRKPI